MRRARDGPSIPGTQHPWPQMGLSRRRSNRHPTRSFSSAGGIVSRSQGERRPRKLATQSYRRRRFGVTPSKPRELLKRTVRRHQLRQMVPLADTTIYEMEQRGEFPRRFYLTPRCVAWDAAEIEGWLEERRRASDASGCLRLTSENARADQSGGRFGRNQLHGCGKEHRRMFAPLNPGIDHVGPFLQHVTTLLLVLRLVIDPRDDRPSSCARHFSTQSRLKPSSFNRVEPVRRRS